MSVNKVILVGNVGKDPEVRHLDAGVAVANFPLATSETYTAKNGEKVTTMLKKEDVLKVERQNKKSSGFFGLIGITIGVASVILAVLML